jgi:nucleoside-diphosphate-sugar epimerase
MESILVTGGTGFLGSYVIKRLVADGHLVYALVRDEKRFANTFGCDFPQEKALHTIVLHNSTDLASTYYKRLIEQYNINTVVHVAGIVGDHWKVPWSEYFRTNVKWTENLAQGFLNAKVNRNKFLFTSTAGVYGTIPKTIPALEELEYNPDGHYHKSKVLAEKLLRNLQIQKGLPLLIFRPTTLYGSGDRGFLCKIFRLVRKGVFPLVECVNIHLLDVRTLVDVYSEAIMKDDSSYSIFNVADAYPVTMQALVSYIKERVGGNFLKVPDGVFTVFIRLLGNNSEFSIKLELLSKNRSYGVQKLEKSFRCKLGKTINNLRNVMSYCEKA